MYTFAHLPPLMQVCGDEHIVTDWIEGGVVEARSLVTWVSGRQQQTVFPTSRSEGSRPVDISPHKITLLFVEFFPETEGEQRVLRKHIKLFPSRVTSKLHMV